MHTVEEISAAADAARWDTYSAWAQMRAERARLMSDLATKASPAVVAADRAALAQSRQQFARHRSILVDVTV